MSHGRSKQIKDQGRNHHDLFTFECLSWQTLDPYLRFDWRPPHTFPRVFYWLRATAQTNLHDTELKGAYPPAPPTSPPPPTLRPPGFIFEACWNPSNIIERLMKVAAQDFFFGFLVF